MGPKIMYPEPLTKADVPINETILLLETFGYQAKEEFPLEHWPVFDAFKFAKNIFEDYLGKEIFFKIVIVISSIERKICYNAPLYLENLETGILHKCKREFFWKHKNTFYINKGEAKIDNVPYRIRFLRSITDENKVKYFSRKETLINLDFCRTPGALSLEEHHQHLKDNQKLIRNTFNKSYKHLSRNKLGDAFDMIGFNAKTHVVKMLHFLVFSRDPENKDTGTKDET